MIRLLIVDDHPAFRRGLELMLSDVDDIEVVAQAASGEEAVELAAQATPDVVLMDLSLPVMDGLEATRRIRRELPEVQVIGLSMFNERERGAAMLTAGAAAYLSKSGRIDVLLETIRRVHAGRAAAAPAGPVSP